MLLSLSSLKTFFMGSRRNAPMIMPSSSHSSSSWGFLMRYCCLWSLRILKEIKVSLITFEVMPDMVNTLSVVCRFEFVYGHHQLELNRPSWKMSSGLLTSVDMYLLWCLLSPGSIWIEIEICYLYTYVGGIQSHWPKIKVMETSNVLESNTILNSRKCKSPQPISGIQGGIVKSF